MKYAISFFAILLLAVCALLFFQYQVYSDQLETEDGDFSYTQEIEITYRGGSLDIRHHFHNLSNQEIDITWPNRAVSTDCFLDGKTSCDRLKEDKTGFSGGEARNASLSYVIPLDGKLQSRELYKDVFVALKNGQATYSTVHITTDNTIKGHWVTGLPLVGTQSLSLVNYAMFSGTGPVSEMYWHSGEMALQEPSPHLSVYSKKALGANIQKQLKSLHYLDEDHLVIVQGKTRSGEQGERIIFMEELSAKAINKSVLLFQVKNQYNFSDSPKWVRDVVASFLSNTTVGSNKSIEMVNTLKGMLTEQQQQDWIEQLHRLTGEKLTTKRLDALLSSVFGVSTNYFEMNGSTENIYPLLFIDGRDISVEDKLQEEAVIVLKDGKILYLLNPVLSSLGYQTKVGKNGYYAKSATQNFRFPLNYGFYVHNQQRYNTVSEPLTIIEGEYYMEELWLQRLFNVEIQKNEETVTVKNKVN